MYVGRIVAVGRTPGGANAALYRVSSRSFPNRRAVEQSGRLAVIPREGHENDIQRSPYIAYNCLRLAGAWAVASNGSHTDPIAEKLASGMSVRDALALSLLALDYERDDYSTPRVAGVVPRSGDTAWLAVVRRDALVVREVELEPGRAWYLATYEADDVRESQCVALDAETPAQLADYVVHGGEFAKLTHPVTSAAAVAAGDRFELATLVV